MKTILSKSIIPKETRKIFNYGWGAGYILIPKSHPLYEISFEDMNRYTLPVEINFSELVTVELILIMQIPELNEEDIDYWMIGFHSEIDPCNDFTESKAYVVQKTNLLLDSILNLKS